MSISRVKVGLPLGEARPANRGGFKWSGPTRSPKKTAVSRLHLTRRLRPVVSSGEPSFAEASIPQEPNIADSPLPFVTARQFCVLILVTLTAVLLVWGMIRSNHRAVGYSYEISRLTKQKTELLEVNRRLNAELASLSTLGQLEIVARDTLGLVTPQQGQIVVIDQ
ncbi:MAG: cell division protein FtsL [Candidatus Adiutrix sp.]|jgi:cell division protein FtsL|nr:cell division protein FtsL [Candidatus Adiutrix sp.]